MPASEPFFVDRISILAPSGFQDQVRDAARQEGQTASEFIRSVSAGPLQLDVPADQADDVDAATNVLDGSFGNATHPTSSSSLRGAALA